MEVGGERQMQYLVRGEMARVFILAALGTVKSDQRRTDVHITGFEEFVGLLVAAWLV
jgi:hypothetical protein